jgi:acyl transferase domain-containing protein/acyl carrier protein
MSSAESIPGRFAQLSPLKQAVLAIEELQARLTAAEQARNEPIAIIGMGCRFPGANGIASFWKLLETGSDAVREVPESRWKIDDYYDPNPDAPGKMSSRWGGFLDAIDQFDPEFFGISPREATFMDPQQRLLLEVSWEALENAGQSPRDLSACQTGIFVGLTSDEYAQLSYRDGDLSRFNAYFASGTARSIAGGRISYVLGVEGPNMSIDTACSSSLVALHSACMHLRMRECRMALAGGVTIILSPEIGIAFSKAHMMASDGRCKAFDARADGFVRGEGCGVVVLKRLSDALTDGDHILAVIRGSAVNQDGRSSGMTAPNGAAQKAVIRTALKHAGVRPEQIGYVEAHGTGTSLGDPIEAHALAQVLGSGREKENPLIIGSVKTNVGHLEAAAGIAGLIKAVLVLEHEQIPAHLHFQQMNPHIDWGGVPVEIPLRARPWPRSDRRRLAGVSSFGFSGTNAHVVLEEAPQQTPQQPQYERPLHLLAVSARSESALRKLGGSYAEALGGAQVPVGDFCFSVNAGRAHFEYRLVVSGSSREELREALLKALPGRRVVDREGVRPVFLFPGQGAQYSNMGKQLFESQPVFRSAIEQCAKLLEGELETPLLDVLWGTSTHLLDQTAYSQPCLFAIEYALSVLWRNWEVEPAAVLGHSVGEYVAACVAGVYSLSDGLKLICRRGRLMQSAGGCGVMSAIRAPESRIREALRGLEQQVSIAAINAPDSVVISGYEEEVKIAEDRLLQAGFTARRLNVSHGFHSPQMNGMRTEFEEVVREIKFQLPQMRIISSVTGRAVSGNEMSQPAYWRRQVSEPVLYRAAIETLRESGDMVFLEVGPGTVLTGLGQQCVDVPQAAWLASIRPGRDEWPDMLNSLAQLYVRGADINWSAFDEPFGRRKVPLPTYPFERQRYWITPPVESSRRIPAPLVPQARPYPEITPTDTHPESNSTDQWFYRIAWKQSYLPVAASAPARLHWILLADETGVAKQLADRIRSAGCSCELIDKNRFDEGRPERQRILNQSKQSPTGIVDMRSMDNVEGSTERSCMALVNLIAEVSQIEPSEVSVWSVTQGAVATGQETNPVLPWLAPAWALGRTLASEHPEFWAGMVDLDPGANSSENADLLWRQLNAGDSEDQAAFRKGSRLVARLERYMPPPADSLNLRSDASYLITGGYGGLGLELAWWMGEQRARTIILVGRTALPPRCEWPGVGAEDPQHRAISTILDLESAGVKVETAAVDVGDAKALSEFLQSYKNQGRPPIRGILHAAGVAEHALVSKSTSTTFRNAFRAKVDGTWHLHNALLDPSIDFFVTFSSASSVLSSPRLGSYAASNAFLDAMAAYRTSKGLPSLSVNWGAWTGIGMAAKPGGTASADTIDSGMTGMRVEEGLACLGRLMAGSKGQVCVLPLDWITWARLYPAYMAKPFFAELQHENTTEPAPSRSSKAASELLDQLKDAPESMRVDRIREFVQKAAANLLGFPPGHWLDPLQPLNEVGLDSLMAIELGKAVGAGVGRSLPATLLFSYPAVEDISTYLSKLLFPVPAVVQPVERLPGAKRSAWDDIGDLSDEEVDRKLAMNWNPANE